MIEETELTEAEKITLKTLVLERQKKKIEKEIEEMKKNKIDAKPITRYFED